MSIRNWCHQLNIINNFRLLENYGSLNAQTLLLNNEESIQTNNNYLKTSKKIDEKRDFNYSKTYSKVSFFKNMFLILKYFMVF